jgi:hypothetical protein
MQTSEPAPTTTEPSPAPAESHGIAPALNFWTFFKKHVAAVGLVSILVVIPCFWLPRIEAGDLASHSYNAWLASLVQKGNAPGLWIAPKTNNILVDVLVLQLGQLAGFSAAEKIVVAMAILVFFWGAFSLATLASGRPAWQVTPLLAMFAYGWTFHMGFLNFFLSLGISFVALAILWRARPRRYLFAFLLLPLVWLAHPLGLLWSVAAIVYLLAAKWLNPRFHWLLIGAALAALFAARVYLLRNYQVRTWQGHFYDLNGTDQLILGTRYSFIALVVLLAAAACTVLHALQWRSKPAAVTNYLSVALQLFVIGLLALQFLPDKIWLPMYVEPGNFLCSRFTLVIAVLGCCALAGLRPRILLAALTGGIAIAYFTLVYQDAARTYAMEKQADTLVAKLPQNARVLTTIFPFRGSRIFNHHVVDRACIGWCFNISNSEAASMQFRIRAAPGSRLAAAKRDDTSHMMLGDYVVQAEDLPLWQIFQCGPTEVDLCLRPVHAGSLLNFVPTEAQRARKLK